MTAAPESVRAVRFGPRESRAVLLGLRYPQLGLVVVGGLALVGALNATGWPARWVALTVAALAAALAFTPVRGRCADQYVPVVLGFVAQRLTGQHVYRGGAFRPAGDDGAAVLRLPGELSALEVVEVTVGEGPRTVALVVDRRARTYTAVLAVQGETFALLETSEQARRVEAWGTLLAALGTGSSAVSRIQVLERTVADTGNDLLRHWRRRGTDDASWQSRAYRQLIEVAGGSGLRHETFVAVTMRAADAGRRIRQAGGGDGGAATVLFRELDRIADGLAAAGVGVLGWLAPRALGYVLRTAYDPASIGLVDRRGGGPQDPAGGDGGLPSGVDPSAAGPSRAENSWDSYRTDSAVHRTYWVMEWPRLDVAPGFLAPLLLGTGCRRSVSLVLEPVRPGRAGRMIETRQNTAFGEQAARDRVSRRTTRRQQVEAADLHRREDELVAGHGLHRALGFVTVSADDAEALEEACGEVESAAQRSRLELVSLVGEQDQAFACGALPLARGLR